MIEVVKNTCFGDTVKRNRDRSMKIGSNAYKNMHRKEYFEKKIINSKSS